MAEVIHRVLNYDYFLHGYEIIGFLQHEVSHRILFSYFYHFDSEVDGDRNEEGKEKPGAKGRKTEDSGGVGIDAHIEGPKYNCGKEEEGGYSLEMFFPKSLSNETLSPRFNVFGGSLFAEDQDCQ